MYGLLEFNWKTKSNPYPIRREEDLLNCLAIAEYMSTLDFSNGYWQVSVATNTVEKTAYITEFGKYAFTFMPPGFVGALAIFQQLMNTQLADLSFFVAAYMEDLIISAVHGLVVSLILTRF